MSSLPLPSPSPATCIAAGTFILTEKGNVLIEDLRRGDRVATLDRSFSPVKWIGRRKVDFGALPETGAWINRPVLFSKSSLAPGVPFCDLVVSRCHTILCRGLKVAGNMVNGEDIRVMQEVDEITYYHIEIDPFEFIVANGLGVESYRDVGNRYLFDNYLKFCSESRRQEVVLSSGLQTQVPKPRRIPGKHWLKLSEARGHNLKDIEVAIPMGVLVAVTGVSGSGKSTLVRDVLYRRLVEFKKQPGKLATECSVAGLEGADWLDAVELVDQSPIGRAKLAAHLQPQPSDAAHKPADGSAIKRQMHTLYIFDEPTVGLHFDDVCKLLAAFKRLIHAGGSVLVVEHNLDVVKVADWVIDLGPEGGERGGEVVVCGTPEEVADCGHSYTGQWLRSLIAI
jgi:ABC-type multidrug transport system fused ATPase/permease subunit